ncbi:transposase [Paraburkholderia sp. SIMBA_030]|uniref:transposase n=1 Tax=Paraburkholderia sp. SIMBA_030 TaxID=3085773 RepID=UPI0039797127
MAPICRKFTPAAAFGALYHQRWRIEEAFKRLKHRLRLEAVTGLDYLALQQDFGAKIVADNLRCSAILTGRVMMNLPVARTGFTPSVHLNLSSVGAFCALDYVSGSWPICLSLSTRPDLVSSPHALTLDHPEKPNPISISRTSSLDVMGLKLRALPFAQGDREVKKC